MTERTILILGLLCAAFLLIPSAAAQTEVPVSGPISETVTIPAGEWRAYRVTIASQDVFEFSARVTAGGDIDVYLLTATGYSEYTSPSAPTFEYLVAGTRENTQSFGATVSPSSGTYFLLVDNGNTSADGATGTAAATVAVSALIRSFPTVVVAIVIVVVLAVVVAILLLVRSRRKKRAAMMPPPMMPPPMQPPLQPPMQPPSGPPTGP